MLKCWRERMRSRRQLRDLCALDDHILKDIGLTRVALRKRWGEAILAVAVSTFLAKRIKMTAVERLDTLISKRRGSRAAVDPSDHRDNAIAWRLRAWRKLGLVLRHGLTGR